MEPLSYQDIQGLVLRPARKPRVHHHLFRVDDAAAARGLLQQLTAPPDPEEPPVRAALRVTAGDRFTSGDEPAQLLYVGFTHDGLEALGAVQRRGDADWTPAFPEEFRLGAHRRADAVGDVGANSPAHWQGGLGTGNAHGVITIWGSAFDDDKPSPGQIPIDQLSDELRQVGGLDWLHRFDGQALGGPYEHFGFRDGISQPRLAGGLPSKRTNPEPALPAGLFVLGQPGYGGRVPSIPGLGEHDGANGTFGAFRVIEQDCGRFEAFLQDTTETLGLDPELVAAKLCGRWRNGVSLAVSRDAPEHGQVSLDRLNAFDYRDDPAGSGCPFGSHARRMNPRDGMAPAPARLLRRGLPYGPPFDPARPDTEPRGLLGLFLCASLSEQFEFIMRDWMHDGLFGQVDPLVGSFDEPRFSFTDLDRRSHTVAVPRFVRTRGSAYLFYPSLTDLRALGKGT